MDYIGHRETLSLEMDTLIQERDGLLNESREKNEAGTANHPLRVRIDEWEKDVIRQVHQAADQARQQIEQILTGKQTSMAKTMEKFSEELAMLKDSHDFVETDLARLKQTLEQFRQDLERVTEPIALDLTKGESDRIPWARLISVSEKSIQPQAQAQPSGEQQRQWGRGRKVPVKKNENNDAKSPQKVAIN